MDRCLAAVDRLGTGKMKLFFTVADAEHAIRGAKCCPFGGRTRRFAAPSHGRLKDFRRIATRYDKLAANFASAVALVSIVSFWC